MKDINTQALKRDLLDGDGENRAVRTFLQLYGCTNSPSVEGMRAHLSASGFDGCWPEWVEQSDVGTGGHLTKGGAQDWLRHLFSLESVLSPIAVTDISGQDGERELLRKAAQVISWQCFGECRAFGEDAIQEPSEIVEKIRAALSQPPTLGLREFAIKVGYEIASWVNTRPTLPDVEVIVDNMLATYQPPAVQVPEALAQFIRTHMKHHDGDEGCKDLYTFRVDRVVEAGSEEEAITAVIARDIPSPLLLMINVNN